MRIATRLVLVMGATFALVIGVYAVISQNQRERLLRDALIRETDTLAQTLQIVTNNALRDGRYRDLNRVLGEVVEDPETFVASVLDARGARIAGGTDADAGCLDAVLPRPGAPTPSGRGWADCAGGVRWVTRAAAAPAAQLVLARRATVIEKEVRASRLRLLVLTLLLTTAAALAILAVLRGTLSAPLREIERAIRAIGSAAPFQPIRVSPRAGELYQLAAAFNAMSGELQAREQRLIREAEERLALEQRLQQAERFAAVGRLSGGLAHELGSPLNVIGMRAEFILDGADAGDPVRPHAAVILDEVDRISQLVRGLLLVGRRHGVRPESVVLQDVIHGLLDHAAPYTTGAGVEVRAELPEQPIVVRGQATLLRHAILNLVRNAAQAVATQPGEHRLSIVLEQTETGVRVVVDDTGPGIPEEHLPKIFEPFYSTKDVGEGTGLGLAVSRGIVEEHGGELRLHNREGGGVRAILTLPLDGESAAGGEMA